VKANLGPHVAAYLPFATSETGRDFASAVVETVDQE
jgi:hypothetical protein